MSFPPPLPPPSLPPLPPRSATEIVDGAVQLIRPHFGYFIRLATVGAIPALIQAVVTLLVFPAPSTDPTVFLRQQLTLLPLSLLTYVFATLQSGAVIVSALAVLNGETIPTVWTAFRRTLGRLLPLIGANLLLVLVLMAILTPIVIAVALVSATSAGFLSGLSAGGTGFAILAVILAVIFLIAFLSVFLAFFARSAIMTCLVIVERLGPMGALRRAHALSKGSNFLLVKTYGLLVVILGVFYAVIIAVASGFQGQQQILQAVMSVLIIPVVPILGGIMLLSYADLRVRREGADLDAALDALTGPEAALIS